MLVIKIIAHLALPVTFIGPFGVLRLYLSYGFSEPSSCVCSVGVQWLVLTRLKYHDMYNPR